MRSAAVAAEVIPSYTHGEPVIGSVIFLGLFAVVAVAIVIARRRR